jgi:hypothetical protein
MVPVARREISATEFDGMEIDVQAPVLLRPNRTLRISQKVAPVAAKIENPDAVPHRCIQYVVEVSPARPAIHAAALLGTALAPSQSVAFLAPILASFVKEVRLK